MEKVSMKLVMDEDIVKSVHDDFRCELDLHFCQNQLGGRKLVDAVQKFLHDLYLERRDHRFALNGKNPCTDTHRTKEMEFAMKITVLNDLVESARSKSIFGTMDKNDEDKFSIGRRLYGIDSKNIRNQRQIQQAQIEKLEKEWEEKKRVQLRREAK